MPERSYDLRGVRVMECAAEGLQIRSDRDAVDLVTTAWSHQARFHGKTAPGLSLKAAWIGPQGKGMERVGTTDSEGRIVVPLKSAGKWRLHTIKMERCTEPAAADWESFWASLTFEVR
jgi:hypothetical protein